MKKENLEAEIKEFMKSHQDLTLEQIKKCVRSAFPKAEIYNEHVERLMIEVWEEMRAEKGRDDR